MSIRKAMETNQIQQSKSPDNQTNPNMRASKAEEQAKKATKTQLANEGT